MHLGHPSVSSLSRKTSLIHYFMIRGECAILFILCINIYSAPGKLEFENTSQSLCSFNKTWIGSQRKRLIDLSVEVPIWILHRQVSHYHKTNYSDIEALLVLFSYWLWFTLFWYWQIACAVCDCQRLTLSWYWCIVCFVSFDDCPWFTSIYPDCHINVAYTDLPD